MLNMVSVIKYVIILLNYPDRIHRIYVGFEKL